MRATTSHVAARTGGRDELELLHLGFRQESLIEQQLAKRHPPPLRPVLAGADERGAAGTPGEALGPLLHPITAV